MIEGLNSSQLKLMVDVLMGKENLEKPGIYGFFLDKECIYVGKAKNLLNRLLSHLTCIATSDELEDKRYNTKYIYMKQYIDELEWKVLEPVDDEDKLDDREAYWINYYDPIFNLRTPDGECTFTGTEEDIENYMYGLYTMDDLRDLKLRNKKEKHEEELKRLDNIDPKWLNRKLTTQEKRELCAELDIRDGKGRALKWTGIKRLLLERGMDIKDTRTHGSPVYSIIEKKIKGGPRYSIIESNDRKGRYSIIETHTRTGDYSTILSN